MSEKYQIFEHFNPSCKHFSVAKYFLSNGTSKGFYYALTLLNILNTKLWTKLSSLRRAKLTWGTFYFLHQVFSFQARYLLSNLNDWCRSFLRTTTKSCLIIILYKRPWKTSSFPMKLRQNCWKWENWWTLLMSHRIMWNRSKAVFLFTDICLFAQLSIWTQWQP